MLLTLIMFTACYLVQPHAQASFSDHPWIWILPALAFVALGGTLLLRRLDRPMFAFLCSVSFIYLFIFGGTAALYPNLLPGLNPEHHLTIYNTSPSPEKLAVTLWWWIPGIILVGLYFTILFRSLPKVISAAATDDH